jgi:hypothetical protein
MTTITRPTRTVSDRMSWRDRTLVALLSLVAALSALGAITGAHDALGVAIGAAIVIFMLRLVARILGWVRHLGRPKPGRHGAGWAPLPTLDPDER